MGSKKKTKKENASLEQVFFGARRRLVASRIFFSKQLEEKRLEAVQKGAAPWKILRYQRVVDPENVPFPLNAHSYVTPELFKVHIKYLSKYCKVIPLTKLVKMIENYEEIPARTVVLTFDGGFASTFLNATSVLYEYGLPATHFIPTGYVESDSFLLDDKILMCLIVLIMNDQEIPSFEFIEDSLVDDLNSVGKKLPQQALSHYVATCRTLEEPDREALFTSLLTSASRFSSLPSYVDFLDWEDIETLRERTSAEIGSLGHFLISRPKASAEEILSDIELSFETLKEEEIETNGLLAIPSGMDLPYASSVLGKTNLRYILLNEPFAEPRFQQATPMLLGRISISQLNAYCLETFACRMFEVSSANINF